MMNNVHSDEAGAVDAHMNLLRTLATEDTVTWNTITGLTEGEVDMSQYDPRSWTSPLRATTGRPSTASPATA